MGESIEKILKPALHLLTRWAVSADAVVFNLRNLLNVCAVVPGRDCRGRRAGADRSRNAGEAR